MTIGTTGVLVVAAYLIASVLATLYVRRRGFTGKRLALLVMLVWLVPFVGAGCASIAAWEWGKGHDGADPIPDAWHAANARPQGGADGGGDNE